MSTIKNIIFTIFLLSFTSCAGPTKPMSPTPQASIVEICAWPKRLTGNCDASAAIVRADRSFLVGDDETDVLTEYDCAGTKIGAHEPSLKLLLQNAGAELDPDSEIDIEGVAVLQTDGREIAFWIGSHARRKVDWKDNGEVKKAKLRKNRRVLFATNIPETGNLVALEGVPAIDLDKTLLSPPSNLEQTLEPLREPEKLWANAGGWNIEGLAPGPDGDLLVGFRSPPNRSKQALVLSISNPLDSSSTVLQKI